MEQLTMSIRGPVVVLFAVFIGLVPACSSNDSVAPPSGTVACAEREAVPLPVETGPVGTIRTWAGDGQAGYDGGCNALLQSSLYWPVDIEFTPDIGTFIVDWNNHRIRHVTDKGRLETIVGSVIIGDGPTDLSDTVYPGANGTSCRLNHPTDVFERSNGTLVIVSWHNHKLREWDPITKKVFVIIGREPNCAGDGGSALNGEAQPTRTRHRRSRRLDLHSRPTQPSRSQDRPGRQHQHGGRNDQMPDAGAARSGWLRG